MVLRMWSGSIRFRIERMMGSCEQDNEWTFGFHKRRGISWIAERVFASREDLCPMELVLPFSLCCSTQFHFISAAWNHATNPFTELSASHIQTTCTVKYRTQMWVPWRLRVGGGPEPPPPVLCSTSWHYSSIHPQTIRFKHILKPMVQLFVKLVNLSLCLTMSHTTKTYGGVDV